MHRRCTGILSVREDRHRSMKWVVKSFLAAVTWWSRKTATLRWRLVSR
ncbi:unnamed protein product [Spirodela intermedia]|uniref:Uncharacterized protein n=1 Tax=Spirodela intermedia TaxID=51605 RepID=A0A7I8KX98_SPIIN|nr:unnamed protein product [Spirodela intermedia]